MTTAVIFRSSNVRENRNQMFPRAFFFFFFYYCFVSTIQFVSMCLETQVAPEVITKTNPGKGLRVILRNKTKQRSNLRTWCDRRVLPESTPKSKRNMAWCNMPDRDYRYQSWSRRGELSASLPVLLVSSGLGSLHDAISAFLPRYILGKMGLSINRIVLAQSPERGMLIHLAQILYRASMSRVCQRCEFAAPFSPRTKPNDLPRWAVSENFTSPESPTHRTVLRMETHY